MRSFLPLTTLATAVFATADFELELPAPGHHVDTAAPNFPARYPEITVKTANKKYDVLLECVGCPVADKDENNTYSWLPAMTNVLAFGFEIEQINGVDSTLTLNGRRILPLEEMPLSILSGQGAAKPYLYAEFPEYLPYTGNTAVQLAFEHTMLRTHEGAERMIQFDVTGMEMYDNNKVVSSQGLIKLDKEGQKLIQIQLAVHKDTREVSIADLQVVEREQAAKPFVMPCGRLAMAKTVFNPTEWDTYGKIGSWSRFFNQAFAFIDLHQNPLLLPVALMLGIVGFMLRRWLQSRGQGKSFEYDDEAQVALLDEDFDELPPAYANVPMIKIEEYD